MVMSVLRAKVTTNNSMIWLKHSIGLLGCYILDSIDGFDSCEDKPYLETRYIAIVYHESSVGLHWRKGCCLKMWKLSDRY